MITLDKRNTLREQFYSLQFGSENSMFTSLLHSAVQMNSSTFSSDTLEQQYFPFKMNNLFNVYLPIRMASCSVAIFWLVHYSACTRHWGHKYQQSRHSYLNTLFHYTSRTESPLYSRLSPLALFLFYSIYPLII